MKPLSYSVALLFALNPAAQAMTIEEYLKQVALQNKTISSYELSAQSAKEKQTAADIGLSPVLTASYAETSDESLPSQLGTKREVDILNIGLAKKFSTGTAVSLTGETYKYVLKSPTIPVPSRYSSGQLGISLQQSLWRDSFGRATRLRQNRDALTARLETYGVELKRRAALIQAESDYWDYLVANEDVKLKKANLERTKKLENWTKNRVSNGISDKVDLLQIQALTGLRELEYANAQDELAAKEIKIRENLGLTADQQIPTLSSDFVASRPYITDLKNKSKVYKIENYLTLLEAKIKETVAEEARDALRPDLSLVGKYNTSSYNTDHQQMQADLSRDDYPVTYVGVNFSWAFGSDAVSAQKSSAYKESKAAASRAQQAEIESANAWKEHLRKYELTKLNVERLEKIAKLQSERSKQEQIKFSKGRSITFNVVNAETESAEAEVNYLKAKSGLRKLEAATLLFVADEAAL